MDTVLQVLVQHI